MVHVGTNNQESRSGTWVTVWRKVCTFATKNLSPTVLHGFHMWAMTFVGGSCCDGSHWYPHISTTTRPTPASSSYPQSPTTLSSGGKNKQQQKKPNKQKTRSNLRCYWYKMLSGHHAPGVQGNSLWLRWASSFLVALLFLIWSVDVTLMWCV